MKYSFLIIITLSLFNNSFAQTESDRWIEVTQTKELDKFFIGYEIVDETETTGNFWTKVVYGNEKPKIDNKSAKEKVSLVTFDFENKKYKTINSYYYDFKGEQLKSIDGDYDFKIMVPETLIESAYYMAKKIKYYAIELQKSRIDSLKDMVATGDSLYTQGSLERCLQYFQDAKALKEVIAKNKVKNKYVSDNDNEDPIGDKQINIDDRISQIQEQIKTQNKFLSLISKAKAVMSTDPLQSIDYLEEANQIKYNKEIADKISELKEGIKTKKVNSLIEEANSIIPNDTLLGIKKLNEAYEIRPSEELKNRISILTEDYRIRKLHLYLESEKIKFNSTKYKINFQDSMLTKNKLKSKEHLLDAYNIYYKYLLFKASSFTMVDNYFSATTIDKTVGISGIDNYIKYYNVDIADVLSLQSYLLTLNQDDIKKLNKELKKAKTIDEVKFMLIFK